MNEQEKRLFEGPKIIEVDGNEVRPGVLGEVHFDSGEIFVPSFKAVLDGLKSRAREAYRPIVDAVKNYIAAHEVHEFYSRPDGEQEHAQMDAYVLDRIDPDAGLVGSVIHGLRSRYGSREQRRFSELVSRYSPTLSAYRAIEEKYPHVVDGVKKLLGLKPFDPDEVRYSVSDWLKGRARHYVQQAIEPFLPRQEYRPAFAEVEA